MIRSRATWALAGAALLAAAVAVGYLLGHEAAPTAEEAEAEERAAYVDALREARATASAASRGEGRTAGVSEGRTSGERQGKRDGREAGGSEVELQQAAAAAAAAEADAAEEPVVVCDGAIADDAHYAACLEQSGQAVPPGFPGGPAGCPTEPPFPVEGPCAGVRP